MGSPQTVKIKHTINKKLFDLIQYKKRAWQVMNNPTGEIPCEVLQF